VSRSSLGKWMLALPMVMFLLLNGCNSRAYTDVRTAQPSPKPEPDIRLTVRTFLKNMPADWNLVPPSRLADTRTFVADVREPNEYATGSIEGAANVPVRGLLDNLAALPGKDMEFVLVSDSGHRSAVGMAVLQMLGYSKARSLEGGLRAWQREKRPMVSNPAPKPLLQGGDPGAVDPQLKAMLSYYLMHTLPVDWGAISPERLTEDQKRKSSTEIDPMAETFDQGRSALVTVDDPTEAAASHLNKAINLPLRRLADDLNKVSLEPAIHWA
jgi:rhodanese-related sulfurtransferase